MIDSGTYADGSGTLTVYGSGTHSVAVNNANVAVGEPATFTADVTGGSGTYTYEWYDNGVLIPSETGSSLSFIASAGDDGHIYKVRVIDGSTYADGSGTLTVLSAGTYKLIFDPNAGAGGTGTPFEVYPLASGEKYQLPDESDVGFSNSGYILIGWSETTSPAPNQIDYLTGEIFTMPVNNVILYAVWGDITTYTHSIEYYPNGADVPSGNTPAIEYFQGDAPVQLKSSADLGFEKADHVITSWSDGSTEYDITDSVTPGPLATPLQLYAGWEEGEYKVTYVSAGTIEEGMPDDVRANENDPVSVFEESTKNLFRIGYEFDGWIVTPSPVDLTAPQVRTGVDKLTGNGSEIFTMPAHDVVLTADWIDRTSDSFEVKYDGNGYTGTVPADCTYQYNEKVTVESSSGMNYDGYTFKNWNTEAHGTGISYNDGETFRITDNVVTLYAQWQRTGGSGGSGHGGPAVIVDNGNGESSDPSDSSNVSGNSSDTGFETPLAAIVTIKVVDRDNPSKVLDAAFELLDANGNKRVYSTTSGLADIELEPGTYRLYETKAPTGYRLLKDFIELTVNEDMTIQEVDGLVQSTESPEIYELVIFKDSTNSAVYYFLLILVLLAILLFVYKKIRDKKEEQ
ncbi:hypothetical protein MmiAt1_12540 [Methanimicrococcus sp. At1]|uniref:SpaA-like prealbumin fold domain-containing protein n=1 Tax=Methanimicrococcus hacksteinii TaxID=3028293 RepID=A0ABU3VQG6_9EURY|nr:hypothetical protein [Methanimicrococcus sp. At1]